MLHKSGALKLTSAALEPQCCTGVGRGNPPMERGNLNGAQEWGAGTHQWSAGTSMLHRSGAWEPTNGAQEPQCCTGVGRGNPPMECGNLNAAQEWGAGTLTPFGALKV